MKMTLEMDMDHTAFGGWPEGEAARILKDAAWEITESVIKESEV